MLQSHVIEVDGNFVGAAVVESCGYRFVAVDLKLGALDGSVWPQLADLRRAARRLSLSTRLTGGALAS